MLREGKLKKMGHSDYSYKMTSKHKTLFLLFKLEIILLATITSKNEVELPISSTQSGTHRDAPIWMFGANHIQDHMIPIRKVH